MKLCCKGGLQAGTIAQPSLADCLYLELSQRWNIPLVTADRVFRDRVVERFPKVRLLKGIEPQ